MKTRLSAILISCLSVFAASFTVGDESCPITIRARADVLGPSGLVRIAWDAPAEKGIVRYEVVRTTIENGKRNTVRIDTTGVKSFSTLVVYDQPPKQASASLDVWYEVKGFGADGKAIHSSGPVQATVSSWKGSFAIQHFDDNRAGPGWKADGTDGKAPTAVWRLDDGRLAFGPKTLLTFFTDGAQGAGTSDQVQITARVRVIALDKSSAETNVHAAVGLIDTASTDLSPMVALWCSHDEKLPKIGLGSSKDAGGALLNAAADVGKVAKWSGLAPDADHAPWYWIRLRVDRADGKLSLSGWFWADDGKPFPDFDPSKAPLKFSRTVTSTATWSFTPFLFSGPGVEVQCGEFFVEKVDPAPAPAAYVLPSEVEPKLVPVCPTNPQLVAVLPTTSLDNATVRTEFSLLPTVSVIRTDRLLVDDGSALPEQQFTYVSSFERPAHFPLPVFRPRYAGEAANDCLHEQEGAIIHEGMSLAFNDDGTYEVRFEVTAPAMPVTMNLQLFARLSPGSARVGSLLPEPLPPGVPFSLTLPPVVLSPPPFDTALNDSYRVVFRGQSRELQARVIEAKRAAFAMTSVAESGGTRLALVVGPWNPELELARRGRARFGSVVEPSQP